MVCEVLSVRGKQTWGGLPISVAFDPRRNFRCSYPRHARNAVCVPYQPVAAPNIRRCDLCIDRAHFCTGHSQISAISLRSQLMGPANNQFGAAKGTISANTPPLVQLASFCSFAKGLSPSQVCMAAASCRFPVKIIRRFATAARTVSSPIQIAVMVRRSTDT